MNILFLGGAKRVSMGQRFLREINAATGKHSTLYSYELSEAEAIACIGEVIVGLKWSDANILDDLKSVVEKYNIGIVVPFVDKAIEIAIRLRDEAHVNVFVPAGKLEPAKMMSDKVRAAKAFEDNGIPCPKTYPSLAEATYPLIAKPRFGAAAKGLIIARSKEDAERLKFAEDEYIIQEYIEGAQEITIDCYRNVTTGEILCISPRLRLEVSGGEVVSTQTIDSPEAVTLAKDVLTRLDLRGAVTVQLLEKDGRMVVMEVNPRLGGGAVATCCAEGKLPQLIINEALGLEQKPVTPTPNILVKRYLSETAFKVCDTQ